MKPYSQEGGWASHPCGKTAGCPKPDEHEGIVEFCDCLNWDSGGSNHPGFYFKGKYEYNDRGDLNYHVGFDENIEVIGNIYENPELLKG